MDDYYPFGHTFNSYSRENSLVQDYKYNGKEMQDELGLGWLDYGARMYQPDLGRFFSQDRFAEKYYVLTPYHYGANNPLLFVDINGDSLIVGGEQTAIDKFKSISNQALGGFYTTTVGKNGLVTLEATGKKGEMTEQQQAFFAGMSQSTSLEAPVVQIGLVESSNQVLVGSYSLQQIDVDDLSAFGSDGPATVAGALIHEVAEQTYKQTMGLGDTKAEYNMAHGLAITNENEVNGSTRGEELPSSAMTSPRASYNAQYNQSSSGHVDIQYTQSGQSRTVSLQIRNGNVKSVSK